MEGGVFEVFVVVYFVYCGGVVVEFFFGRYKVFGFDFVWKEIVGEGVVDYEIEVVVF